MKKQNKYWLLVLLGTLLASSYPIYMGFKVIYHMTVNGSVPKENFPKYIIPYTPIAIALLFAVIFMPLIIRLTKKFATLCAALSSLGVFLAAELVFESKVIVTDKVMVPLEAWQMVMCYVSPDQYETRSWTAIDVLMGEYSPWFKLHFYLISAVIIVAVINVLYGFATADKSRYKALILQAASALDLIGLALLACFTAFFRDGELTVAPISAILMAMFFISLGATAGIFVATFLAKKNKTLSVLVPSVTASAVTLLMYIGEMCLLSGNLYILGKGFFFEPLPFVVLSVADILIVIASGVLTALVCGLIRTDKLRNR
ncbi:MAG: hypothetical protein IJB57_00315 [Clostridia bacterium]|nr:hypothetical protein [Clostridia bacterium]